MACTPPSRRLLVRDDVVVSAHAADAALPVGSLVKLLSAVVWMQRPERLEATVTISRHAAGAAGARVGLRAGERYLGKDLLTAMLVRSANDACLALAEQAAGSEAAFVAAVTRAAALLELHDSRFANPCGLDAPGQHSSARDMLAVARLAMSYPAIRDRVGLERARFGPRGRTATRELRSTNLLLGRFRGADGVKTGFTAQAGGCLIAHAVRDGHEAWLVMLHAPERWWTAHRMLDSAFRHGG